MAVNKIFIPTFISSVNYQPVRTLPHIYFYNGLKECEPYYIEHYTSTTGSVTASVQNQFPYVDNYDGLIPTTGSRSLLFFNESTPYGQTPTASLYETYWETYVNLLYNPRTRLINCSAIIPLSDYFEMELNDIVQWRGNYYHLRAINSYNLKDGTCQLQLLGPIISDATQAVPTPADCSFTFSSSFEYQVEYDVELYMQGGGGGSSTNGAGGGGAGGYMSGITYTVTTGSLYSVIIGAGGAGAIDSAGSNGGVTSFGTNTSITQSVLGGGGGAGGGTGSGQPWNGRDGGNGGGAHRTGSVGLGIDSPGTNGNNGGTGRGTTFNTIAGGGGGGPQGIGGNAFSDPDTSWGRGGTGGAGSILFPGLGLPNGYIGGGGSGGGRIGGGQDPYAGINSAPGGGGCGSPCISASRDNQGFDGFFPGGGAGGHGNNVYNVVGKNGASGQVYIRYPGAQRGSGGVVTTSGSYTYHWFTSSGNFIG